MPAKAKTVSKKRSGGTIKKNNLGKLVKQYMTNIEEKKYITMQGWATAARPQGLLPILTWSFQPLLCEYNAIPTSATGIIQGSAVNQRIGNKIKLTGIDIVIVMTPTNGTAYGSFCRMCIVHDKKHNSGSTLSGGNVFTRDDVWGVPNPLYSDRYTVSNDMVHQMVITTTSPSSGPEGLYKVHLPFKTVIEYNGTPGGLNQIINHMFWLGYVTDYTPSCVIAPSITVSYTDA